MPLSAGLLLLLLSGLHADSEVKVVNAMVGSDVELSCVFPHRSHFDLNELYVYWQISGSDTVVTYYLSDNKSEGHEDPRYKDRAHLLLDRMKQGDFSLHLQNVTPQDAQQFKCLVIKEPWKPGKLLEKVVRLNVAANFSVPVVSTSSNTSQDQELTFTCMSTDGYPRPNVYWINRTDNSLLHEALQNNTVFLNQRGLYDVVSILTIPRTPHVDVGCCIENVLLHQNLTSSSQAESFTGNKGRFTKSPDSPREEENAALYSLPSLLSAAAVIVAVAVAWGCRSRRRARRGYKGAQAAVPERELTDHA